MKMIKNGQAELLNMKGGENIYIPTVCGVGYIGEGKYKVSMNRKHTIEYDRWKGMLRRCYDEKERYKNSTYSDVTICDEWLNFQNFAEWWNTNYYSIDDEKMQLDKDILVKGNKIYSPEYCIFVPQCINSLFVKRDQSRGDLPIGVGYDKKRNKYRAYCSIKKKLVAIGNNYHTPEDAFYKGYKPFKEKVIKEMADRYKENIPVKLYDAMMNYEVEISD